MHESRFGVLKMLEYHWDRKQCLSPSFLQVSVAAGGEIAVARTDECDRQFVCRHLRQCAPNFIDFDFFPGALTVISGKRSRSGALGKKKAISSFTCLVTIGTSGFGLW